MKYLKTNILTTAVILAAIFTLKTNAAEAKPDVQLTPGLIAEHVKSLNTLAMSFMDLSQPLYTIKLQILTEFLINSPDPRLILLVTDDRDIQTLNAFIKKQKPEFDLQKIKFVKGESTFLSSSWMRDFSPMMVLKKDGSQGLVIFKYENDGDYAVDQNSVAKTFSSTIEKAKLRLEGGNTLSDEEGRLYISTAVLDNNPEVQKAEVEKILKAKLLAREIVWIARLNRDFEGTGHVDMYIRLLKNKQAVVAQSTQPEISKALDEIAKVIETKGFKVTRLKTNAKMVNRFRDQKIFASYTNSILVGESIFIPKYGVPEDKVAVSAYQKLGYKVVQIDGESIHFGGSVHCLTYIYP